MIPNIDEKTDIHYGVIPVMEMAEWFYDELETIYHCEGCDHLPARENDEFPSACDFCENYSNVIRQDGLEMLLTEHNDVWVFKSPVCTHCNECSPCAPNAGYILDQAGCTWKTYIPPKKWLRDSGKFCFWTV